MTMRNEEDPAWIESSATERWVEGGQFVNLARHLDRHKLRICWVNWWVKKPEVSRVLPCSNHGWINEQRTGRSWNLKLMRILCNLFHIIFILKSFIQFNIHSTPSKERLLSMHFFYQCRAAHFASFMNISVNCIVGRFGARKQNTNWNQTDREFCSVKQSCKENE